MNFGFTEEQELLRKTARDFLAEHASSAQIRAVMLARKSLSIRGKAHWKISSWRRKCFRRA
jgi:hypothetical protein